MRTALLAACTPFVCASSLLAAAPSVRAITFAELDYPRLREAAMNNRGDIAFETGDDVHVLWADGSLERLAVQDAIRLRLVDIGDSGHVMVRSQFPQTPEGVPRMLHYAQRGGLSSLALDPLGGPVSQVGRLNAGGRTIATAVIPGSEASFFYTSPGSEHIPIRQIPLNASAFGVNDADHIAAGMRTSYGNTNNWLTLFDTEGRRLRETYAGAGDWWFIRELNNEGVAIGRITPENNIGDTSAFLWDTNTGEITRLDPPKGFTAIYATALNDMGWFTAHLELEEGSRVPYIWTPETGFFELSSLIRPGEMINFSNVLDLNNQGEILIKGGAFVDGDWREALFVVTIPAPASSLALGGLAVFATRRRR